MARIVSVVCDHCEATTGVTAVEAKWGGRKYLLDLCPDAVAILSGWAGNAESLAAKPGNGRPPGRPRGPRQVFELDENGEPILQGA
jgi:hypothetical protein